MGGLRKLGMKNDSRKAQHNSFAYHRAALLSYDRLVQTGISMGWSTTTHEAGEDDFQIDAATLGAARAPAQPVVAA